MSQKRKQREYDFYDSLFGKETESETKRPVKRNMLVTYDKFEKFYPLRAYITQMIFSNDDRFLFASYFDEENLYPIVKYDFVSGKIISVFKGHTQRVEFLVLSSDNMFLFSGSNNEIIKWNAETNKVIRVFQNDHDFKANIAVSPDNKFLFSGTTDNTIIQWDIETKKKLNCFRDTHLSYFQIVFTSDKKQLFFLSEKGNTIECIDISNNEKISFKGHVRLVTCFIFSHDNQFLFSASWDGTIRKWNVLDGKEIFCYETNEGCHQMVLSSDDKYLFAHLYDGSIRQINALADTKSHPYIESPEYTESPVCTANIWHTERPKSKVFPNGTEIRCYYDMLRSSEYEVDVSIIRLSSDNRFLYYSSIHHVFKFDVPEYNLLECLLILKKAIERVIDPKLSKPHLLLSIILPYITNSKKHCKQIL